jgi:aldose 1-epimerase
MEIFTTEPGIQFYGGGWLDGSIVGKQGQGLWALLWPLP